MAIMTEGRQYWHVERRGVTAQEIADRDLDLVGAVMDMGPMYTAIHAHATEGCFRLIGYPTKTRAEHAIDDYLWPLDAKINWLAVRYTPTGETQCSCDAPPAPEKAAEPSENPPSVLAERPVAAGLGTDNYPAEGRADTSREAYESLAPKVRGNLRRLVYEVIGAQGGATTEEIEDGAGLGGNTVRPRLKELEHDLFIVKGTRQRLTRSGRTAIVWEIVQHAADWEPPKEDEHGR